MTPAISKMEFFVTLVDGRRSQTNNTTKTFILDVAMVLVRPCETITRINKNIKIDLFFKPDYQ